jgi:hypothetical protein
MKIVGKLNFGVKLKATLPDTGVMGLVDPDAILAKAQTMIGAPLHTALKTVFLQLKFIGVQIEIIESNVSLTRENE